MANESFFIAGITGHVGGAAATQLLHGGHSVRALVRDTSRAAEWSARGVDVLEGDLEDPASIAAALSDVDGAFLLMPPQLNPSARDFPEARVIAASYREALEQVVPPRVVVLSSFGSEKPDRLGMITGTQVLEAALRGARSPLAFVRAGSFLENIAFSVEAATHSGLFMSHLSRAVPMVATADIGALVARLLTGDAWRGERAIELGTPYTPQELAAALTKVVGRPVTAQTLPREEWRAGLIARGMSPLAAELFEEMIDGQNSGWIAFGAAGAEHVPATTTPRAFFQGVHATPAS
jgi:uncharacterized protein YbjT (DUF2867 family)